MLVSVKTDIVRGSVEPDDLDKAVEIEEAMGLSQDDLWKRLGMNSRIACERKRSEMIVLDCRCWGKSEADPAGVRQVDGFLWGSTAVADVG
jgi:hypothetical protein